MSTIAIYPHSFKTPHDEEKGTIGEIPEAHRTWQSISRLVQDWESAFHSAQTTRDCPKSSCQMRCYYERQS